MDSLSKISPKIPPKLESFYSSVPNGEKIIECVKRGEERFAKELKELGLKYDVHVSKLHDIKDVEVQAFICSMSSSDPREIETKAYFVYSSHWLDDFFDEPELGLETKEMYKNRTHLGRLFLNMGKVGEVGFKIIEKAKAKEGAVKGLERILYGGLVGRSHSREDRDKLVSEYTDLGLRFVDEKFAKEIRALQPQAYFITSKVVMEFIDSGETHFGFNVSEVWNLIYAPAIYYHDIGEEEKRDISGFKEDKPKHEEMLKMVKLGEKYLDKFSDKNKKLRIEQLRLITVSFKNVLPPDLLAEYEKILSQHS